MEDDNDIDVLIICLGPPRCPESIDGGCALCVRADPNDDIAVIMAEVTEAQTRGG